MKIKILFAIVLLFSTVANAKDIDLSNNPAMMALYDNFLPAFYKSAEQTLVQNGFQESKAKNYVSALKKRIKKQDLINETYPCLSKVAIGDMETKGVQCLLPWMTKVQEKNADLMRLLR